MHNILCIRAYLWGSAESLSVFETLACNKLQLRFTSNKSAPGILSTLYVLYVVRCTLLGGFCTYPLYVSVR
jgi:hypothetical protein